MRTTRRQILATTAAAAGALLAGGGTSRPARAQGRSTISIALAARSSGGMNPQQVGVNGADNWVASQIFDTLVRSPDGMFATRPDQFRPHLAESWTVSDDARTWTYRLRGGVRFHKDNGEVSADDVAFTFGRHVDPRINTNGKGYYTNIESVAATDRLTAVFRLRQPDPLFNASCASLLSGAILCRRAFEQKGADAFNTDPVGTGAYQFESMSASRGATLRAFPEHFAGAAVTPGLQFRYIADTTSRTLAFASGDVDMIEGVRAPGWMASMRQQSAKTVFDATAPGSLNMLSINLARGPLANLKVRQAIRYAINPAAISGAFGPIATPMVGLMAPQFPGAVKQADLPPDLQYRHDPKKAAALLAEAGFPNGLTIPCFSSQREDYASIMLMLQEQLRAVKINLDMKIIDHATYHSDIRQDRNALILWSLSYPPVPTLPIADLLVATSDTRPDGSGGTNFSHYGKAIPGIDALAEKALAEPDFARRVAIIQEIETQVLRDLPVLGITTLSYVIARNPRVDLGFNVESGPAYWSLRLARRVDA